MNLEKVMEFIAEYYTEEHYLVVNTDMTCGIEDDELHYNAKKQMFVETCEATFPNLTELYKFIERESKCRHVETECNCKKEGS